MVIGCMRESCGWDKDWRGGGGLGGYMCGESLHERRGI